MSVFYHFHSAFYFFPKNWGSASALLPFRICPLYFLGLPVCWWIFSDFQGVVQFSSFPLVLALTNGSPPFAHCLWHEGHLLSRFSHYCRVKCNLQDWHSPWFTGSHGAATYLNMLPLMHRNLRRGHASNPTTSGEGCLHHFKLNKELWATCQLAWCQNPGVV